MARIVNIPLSRNFASDTYINLQANGQSVTNATNPDGIGSSVYIRDGHMVSTILQSDQTTFGNRRSELAFTDSTLTLGEYFYAWEFCIPAWGTDNYILVGQFHDTPDGGDGAKYPNFTIGMKAGFLIGRVPTAGNLPGTEAGTYREVFRVPYKMNHWYQFCLHVQWQTNSTGAMEFLIDRVPVFREYGVPTMYSDVNAPYIKFGCYDGETVPFTALTAYYRNFAIWSGANSYTDVLGGPPVANRPLVLM